MRKIFYPNICYLCQRLFDTGMDDYHTHIYHQTCSFPDCCKDIHISEPEIFKVTRIELNACSTLLDAEQHYRITSTKGTLWTLRSNKCCNGVIYVYLATNTVTTATSRRETRFLPQKTGTATSAVPPLTSFGSPRIPTTEPGNNATSALIIGLVCAVLLSVLCFCGCTYRRYRKTKMAVEKKNKIQPLCEYSVVEEFQEIEAVDNTITHYFVLEARNDSNMTTNTNILPTSVMDPSSSEYESIANLPNIEDDRKEIQDGVYNTLREHEAMSNDTMDNYSHFQDFNQDYNFLSR